MDELDGRRVLVTGASSGIGEATARAVAAAGGSVALLARRADRLAALADELDAVAVPADVADAHGANDAVEQAAMRLDGLDAVVNAAGVMRPGLVADGDPEGWRTMFEVNVLGLLHVTRAAIGHLTAAEPADVVNVSSMSGRRVPSATGGVYAGTKAAVHAISEGLRLELQDVGVRVAIVAPGFVRTALFDDLVDDPLGARYHGQMSEQGMSADDVARSIVHTLAAPAGTALVEVALLPTGQRASGE